MWCRRRRLACGRRVARCVLRRRNPLAVNVLLLPGDDGVVLDNSIAQLIWRSDGNLVVMRDDTLVWESGTAGDGTELCFQNDLTIKDTMGTVLFRSTDTASGVILRLNLDCSLEVTTAAGALLWGSFVTCSL